MRGDSFFLILLHQALINEGIKGNKLDDKIATILKDMMM